LALAVPSAAVPGTFMSVRSTPFALPLLALAALALAGCSALPWRSGRVPDGARAQVAILETTDIHATVLNYGLGFLSQVTGTPMNVDGSRSTHCAGPHFPLVLANVYSARDGAPIFKPWT